MLDMTVNLKGILAAATAAAVMLGAPFAASAGGDPQIQENVPVSAETQSAEDLMSGITCDCAAVTESTTGTFLGGKKADEKRSVSHLAKLMTILIAAEKTASGEISPTDTVSVSAHANSMGGSQIWLDSGEKISVEELFRSITIGNANDACVALAEKIGGSEEGFVAMMNSRAKSLGMKNTHFADCTGISEKTVSTARDLCLLAAELVGHEELREYFTTWMDSVRDGKAELVSTNRLIRTYKGVTGLKSCASDMSGECLAASAKRGDMSVCVVILGAKDQDSKFADAKKLMDTAFSSFGIYVPQPDKKAYADVKVSGGESGSVPVEIKGADPVVLPSGELSSVVCEYRRAESLDAPVKKGDKVGEIVFKTPEKTVITGEIAAARQVDRITLGFAFKKVLLNLLKMKK